MRCIKVKLQDAEKVKEELLAKKILHPHYNLKKEKDYIYFPLTKKIEGYTIYQKTFEPRTKEVSLKTALGKKLTPQELGHIKTSMDIIGTIAILEIDKKLEKKAHLIARTLLQLNKNITTVVQKKGEHSGVFRLQNYLYLAGEKNYETSYKEHGVELFLDIRKTYFSSRLSTERFRIAQQILKGEKVLVFFSGIGVYPLVFSKHSKAEEIYGIEINPDACLYAEKNLLYNKAKNVFLFCGDVREVSSHLGKTFDRIVMPAPHQAEQYLPLLPSLSHKGTIIHYYAIAEEKEFEPLQQKILSLFPEAKIKNLVPCGQVKTRTFRICLDFQL